MVIGDLSLIIRHMHHFSILKDYTLERLILGIEKDIRRFKSIELFQVVRAQNIQANQLANEAT
jgi:hypothetical protein